MSHLRADFREQSPALVLFGDDLDRERPTQAQARIVVTKAALYPGRIEFAHQVDCVGLVLQRLITVRKALRYVDTSLVPRRELNRNMPKIGWRLRAQIYYDVQHRTADAADVLGL
jgi:hypothetical protein